MSSLELRLISWGYSSVGSVVVSMCEALGSILSIANIGLSTYNASTQESEAGGSKVQGYS